MKQATIPASLIILILICAGGAAAQDAQAILRQSSETYVRLRTYHFEGQSEIKIAMNDVNYWSKENIEIARVIRLMNHTGSEWEPAACYVIETRHRPDTAASTSSDAPPETIWIDKVVTLRR